MRSNRERHEHEDHPQPNPPRRGPRSAPACIVGASNLVPKDHRIDGVDTSAFTIGKSPTAGRASYVFCGDDGELMSIKWKIYKMVFRYTIDSPSPAIPRIGDPGRPQREPAIFSGNDSETILS